MENQTPLQIAINALTGARDLAVDVLKGEAYRNHVLNIDGALTPLLNRLHLANGTSATMIVNGTAFKPITNFMGETVVHRKKIELSDLKPDKDEKAIYLQKVDHLYQNFPILAPEKILDSPLRPDDILVLRGVAKKAGINGYEDSEVNISFLEEIASALLEKSLKDTTDNDLVKKLSLLPHIGSMGVTGTDGANTEFIKDPIAEQDKPVVKPPVSVTSEDQPSASEQEPTVSQPPSATSDDQQPATEPPATVPDTATTPKDNSSGKKSK